MRSRLVLSLLCVAALTSSALAQTPPAPPQPARAPAAPRATPQRPETPPPPPPPPPVASTAIRRQGQPVNVKVEFTLSDQRAGSAPIKRTVTLIVADNHTGMVRSQSDVYQVGPVPLNIDTTPELLSDGKIRLGFNIQYDWPAPLDTQVDRTLPRGAVIKTALHDSMSLILESGKPMIAAQSADPIGERQVTVEVKATILK